MQEIAIEVVPHKAQYKPGEDVSILLRIKGNYTHAKSFTWMVLDLHQPILTGQGLLEEKMDGEVVLQMIAIPAIINGSGAYGFFVTVTNEAGGQVHAETAFDIAEHWKEAPRYGFLSDFAPGEDEDTSDVQYLNKHHINVVQFYDWMFRQDQLFPDTEVFVDPLGRENSLQVVKDKINRLHQHGIASMAYAAIYGSLQDYVEKYPEQALYQNDGKPYSLGNFFFIMDISVESGWTKHILREFKKALEWGFDGLHLDQYGFPKKAVRKIGNDEQVVELKKLYPPFINKTRSMSEEVNAEAGLIFNNVSNYPIHTTAEAEQDAMYIEVWDPVLSLRDLQEIIDRARQLSGKQVILAAYLSSFHPDHPEDQTEAEIGATVTMATIFASGGYHLLLGEQENVLADSYYPKYGKISDYFKGRLKQYYDFIVMYRHLLYDHALEDISVTFAGGINTEITFYKEGTVFSPMEQLDTIWNIVKEKPGFTVIHLINLLGLDNDGWNMPKKQAPEMIFNVEITVEMLEQVEGVYWTSPDFESIKPISLSFDWISKDEGLGKYLRFTIPSVAYWSMLYIQTKAGVPQVF